MWHQPVDIGFVELVVFQRFIDDATQRVDRHLEYFVTFHHDAAGFFQQQVLAGGNTIVNREQVFITAIGVHV